MTDETRQAGIDALLEEMIGQQRAKVLAVASGLDARLTFEEIGHGFDRADLKFLIGVKSKLHYCLSNGTTDKYG